MELVDLKSPKKTTKETKLGTMPSPVERDEYPWGTRFTLPEESIAKMEDVYDSVDAEEIVTITAKAKVVSKRSNDTIGNGGKKKKDRSLEFQLTGIHVACKGPYDKGDMKDFMKARGKR